MVVLAPSSAIERINDALFVYFKKHLRALAREAAKHNVLDSKMPELAKASDVVGLYRIERVVLNALSAGAAVHGCVSISYLLDDIDIVASVRLEKGRPFYGVQVIRRAEA